MGVSGQRLGLERTDVNCDTNGHKRKQTEIAVRQETKVGKYLYHKQKSLAPICRARLFESSSEIGYAAGAFSAATG